MNNDEKLAIEIRVRVEELQNLVDQLSPDIEFKMYTYDQIVIGKRNRKYIAADIQRVIKL